jgi:hypothetical protein
MQTYTLRRPLRAELIHTWPDFRGAGAHAHLRPDVRCPPQPEPLDVTEVRCGGRTPAAAMSGDRVPISAEVRGPLSGCGVPRRSAPFATGRSSDIAFSSPSDVPSVKLVDDAVFDALCSFRLFVEHLLFGAGLIDDRDLEGATCGGRTADDRDHFLV